MKFRSPGRLLALSAALLASGCTVGESSMLFVTSTSFGVNIDSSPPTLDVAYARREGTLAPRFKDGSVLPQLASFDGQAGGVLGANQNFAVGRPAEMIAKYVGEMDKKPVGDNDDFGAVYLGTPGVATVVGAMDEADRYVFMTKTVLGLSIGLVSQTSGWPESLDFGWKRKELAYVPLVDVTVPTGRNDAEGNPITETRVGVSSLLATAGVQTDTKTGDTYITQLFATGTAANYLSAQPFVRNALARHLLAADDLRRAVEREKEQSAIDMQIRDAGKLSVQARALIDKLADGQLDQARDAAVASGLLEADDPFPDARLRAGTTERVYEDNPAGRRKYLKRLAGPDTSEGAVDRLQSFVAQLEALAAQPQAGVANPGS